MIVSLFSPKFGFINPSAVMSAFLHLSVYHHLALSVCFRSPLSFSCVVTHGISCQVLILRLVPFVLQVLVIHKKGFWASWKVMDRVANHFRRHTTKRTLLLRTTRKTDKLHPHLISAAKETTKTMICLFNQTVDRAHTQINQRNTRHQERPTHAHTFTQNQSMNRSIRSFALSLAHLLIAPHLFPHSLTPRIHTLIALPSLTYTLTHSLIHTHSLSLSHAFFLSFTRSIIIRLDLNP